MRSLATLPKGHLHLHLEGAMRPSTLAELAAEAGMEVPATSGFGSFTAFSGMYNAACAVLTSHDHLRRLVDEVVADAAAAGAVWVEPATYPDQLGGRLGTGDEVLEVVLEALAAAGSKHQVGTGLMIAADRTLDPADAVAQARRAVRYAADGVVSFGLHNDEVGFPPERFTEAFAVARAGGLLSTPHAGELDGPRTVAGALTALGADRIQHGVRSIEDPLLVERLAEAGTCLDVCPTSNLLLGIYPSLDAHPLPALLAAGVRCSINADDPLLFGPGLLEEYELCRDQLGLDDRALAGIARASIDASGAPSALKACAGDAVDAWLASSADAA